MPSLLLSGYILHQHQGEGKERVGEGKVRYGVGR